MTLSDSNAFDAHNTHSTRLSARRASPRSQWQLEQDGVHPLLARLYAARGIADRDELDYGLAALLPPERLTHAADAAVLLADAIEAQAKILIVADYDCDGATACAVGIRAFAGLCFRFFMLPPSREILRALKNRVNVPPSAPIRSQAL